MVHPFSQCNNLRTFDAERMEECNFNSQKRSDVRHLYICTFNNLMYLPHCLSEESILFCLWNET